MPSNEMEQEVNRHGTLREISKSPRTPTLHTDDEKKPRPSPRPVTRQFPSHHAKHASFLHMALEAPKGMLAQTPCHREGPHQWGATGTVQVLKTLRRGPGDGQP